MSTGNSNSKLYLNWAWHPCTCLSLSLYPTLSLSSICSIIHMFPLEKSYTRPCTSKGSAKTGSEAKQTNATNICIRVDTCWWNWLKTLSKPQMVWSTRPRLWRTKKFTFFFCVINLISTCLDTLTIKQSWYYIVFCTSI